MWVKEITRLAVQGGFLDGVEVHFQRGINCLVGPRGTGKSSVMNLLRFGLGDWPADSSGFLRQMGELLEGGQVEIDFITEFDNHRRVRRKVGRYPRLYDGEGSLIQESSDIRFRLEAYAQGELEQLLDQGGTALMNILDRTIHDLPPLLLAEQSNRQKRNKLQREYEAAADRLVELQEKVKTRQLLVKELEELQLSEPEKRQQAVMQEQALFDFWERFLHSRLRGVRTLLEADYSHCRPDEITPVNPELVEELIHHVNQTLAMREQLAGDLLASLQSGLERIHQVRAVLEERHREQAEHIREALQRQGYQAYEEWDQDRQRLIAELAELTGCEEEYRAVHEQTRRIRERKQLLLLEAQHLENQISRVRRCALNRLNTVLAGNPFIRFHRQAYLDEYRQFLQERLRGTVSRRLADLLARRIDARSLMSLVEKADSELLADGVPCSSQEARQVLWMLGNRSDSGRMTDLAVHDEAELFYQGKAGVEPVCSQRLSKGMQCSLLLPIVLLARQPVLLGDQFEDHLDNACIYEMVIPRLLSLKDQRQIILATHNANIVVAGQADWVISMAAMGGKGRVQMQGRLQEDAIRQEVMATLEGGCTAFHCRVKYLGVG